MRAVVYSEVGPSSVLRLVEVEQPTPGPGEVLVRMKVAGVNPTDWKFRSAMKQLDGDVAPGQDGAGVVEAVGDGVTHVGPGDRVWVFLAQKERHIGTAAEYTLQHANRVVALPDGVGFETGAALGVPFITAHRALTSGEVARLVPGALAGTTVLVHGGAGAVGNAAIQLARHAGAEVITTVSGAAKAELAAKAGADHVVTYTAADVVEQIRSRAPRGVDLVVEVAPAQNNELDRAVTRVGATIAIYANNGGDELQIPLRATFTHNLRYQFLQLYLLEEQLKQNAVADIDAALRAGAIRTGEDAGLPLHRFGLEQTAQAHDAVEQGAIGKVLIEL